MYLRSREFLMSLFSLPIYLLFFMMLFVPTTYQSIKLVLLLYTLLLVSVKIILDGKIRFSYELRLWITLIVSTGLFFIIWGLANNAPGALRVSTVFVIWPLVFTYIIVGVVNGLIIKRIVLVLFFASFLIITYSYVFILYSAGFLPRFFYLDINMGQAIGFHKGYIEYTLFNISSLVFLVPFLMSIFLKIPKGTVFFGVSRIGIGILFFSGLLLVFLTGRRALLLTTSISPIILWLFSKKQILHRKHLPYYFKISFIALSLVCALFYFSNLSLIKLWDMFLQGFDFSGTIGDGSALTRKDQFFALIAGWVQNPILGAGHGAGVGIVRSESMPWAYELTYVALLYQTGLVGFILYTLAILWILKGLHGIAKIPGDSGVLYEATFTGVICYFIANATNPYLLMFDYMWVIFLPLLFIEFEKANKPKKELLHGFC